MIFLNHTLPTRLNQYIESISFAKDAVPSDPVERIVPTGHAYLYIALDDVERTTFDNETLEPKGTFTKAWMVGMHAQHRSISAHEKAEVLVIQFKPEGGYPYTQRKCDYYANQVLAAETVFGPEILELREALVKAATPEAKFELIEGWLKKRFTNKNNPKPAVVEVVNILRTAQNYKKGIAKYPQSQTHLIGQFKKYVGIMPKMFLRIQRFTEILNRIKEGGPMKSSIVSAEYGYTDLPFFIEEFKAFSGMEADAFIEIEVVVPKEDKPVPAFMKDEEE